VLLQRADGAVMSRDSEMIHLKPNQVHGRPASMMATLDLRRSSICLGSMTCSISMAETQLLIIPEMT
jgi:hypothetical protein